jgi:hypothetical protein
MKIFAHSLAALVATSLFSISSFAQSAPPSADTYSYSVQPGQNFGTQPMLAVTSSSKSFIRFDLSELPKNASVSKAALRLYVDAVVASGKFDV